MSVPAKSSFSLLFSRTIILWVIVYFIFMTVLMTWPLVTRMGESLVGQVGDNIYFVWMIGWLKKAVFELHVNPFNVWFLNYPEGWNLAYTEITPAMILIAIPFAFLNGPTFAYNMAMMLTFVLSGLGMFLWVRALTGRTAPALIAGTIFAFIPYHFAHFLIGHLNLSGTQWLPLYFWGFLDVLRLKHPSWKPVILAGVSLGLIGLTSQYYLYMGFLVSGFLTLTYLIFFDRSQWRNRNFWKGMGEMAIVSLPLIILAIAPYVSLNQQGGLPDRNLSIVRMYSASPTDFVIPSTDHFLWGRWIGNHFNREMWVEGTLYVGAVSGILGLLALIYRKKTGQGRLVWLMFLGGAFAFLLAMGTDLHWLGEPITIHRPDFLSAWIRREEIPILLPGYFLFLYFPFYAKLRAFMRFGIFVLVFSSALAGLGAAWLLERLTGTLNPSIASFTQRHFKVIAGERWRAILVVSLLGLVILDFYPGPYQEFTQVKGRPVDTWLAVQPGKGAVIQFPFIEGEDQDQTFYTLIHGKPFIGGFFNAFPPPQYLRIRPIMENFPDMRSIALLGELGVQYVLVDRKAYPEIRFMKEKCQAMGLVFVGDFGDEIVFERK